MRTSAIFRAVAVAAVTLGITATPAQAAPLGVLAVDGLQIQRVGGGDCRVVTTGAVRMESAAAAQFLSDRATFTVRLRGDDPVDDDALYSVGVAPDRATADGQVVFRSEVVLRCGILDEDDDFYDRKDEVYSRVALFAVTGNQTKDSPVWHDYF
jgi:hypothetical protein